MLIENQNYVLKIAHEFLPTNEIVTYLGNDLFKCKGGFEFYLTEDMVKPVKSLTFDERKAIVTNALDRAEKSNQILFTTLKELLNEI